ncbi:MAG: hypothetical protein DCF25_11510 [Leptolyngbya foveolarum]|uniref:histidine kinase n=1 Tax=Leptolyngbya foveolarum TaxID=47253 RepID=A0A2W4U780_9CYAN|nr:MAG: hypothetical protein DCF25_11510 [Leptolyngbya foveolarum]
MNREDTAASSYADLQVAYRQLLALERFKSGFLARTSHELRSPINTIVSLHQLILEDLCEGPEEEKEFIEQSQNAALKMLALFDRIAAVAKLDVSREPPKLQPVDLSFLLPEVEMLTALQAANQNVRYTLEPLTDELKISTDGRWLKNTLVSLIQDAIPHIKKLKLFVEKTDKAIDIVIECDGGATSSEYRSTTQLKAELAKIEAAVHLTEAPTPTPSIEAARNFPAPESLTLSTGLVLAIAQTTLPIIKGIFIIEPTATESSRLICRFPTSS